MGFEGIYLGYQRYQGVIGREIDNDHISCVVRTSTTSYSCFYSGRYATTSRKYDSECI